MKTLKISLAALALFAVTFTAKAKTTGEEITSFSQFHAVNTYIDAVTRGKVDGLDQAVDKTAKFSLLRANQIYSYDKAQMMAFVKENKNQEQGCTVNTSIVSSNADVAVVKVDQNYDGFVRSNYVTLAYNGADWKITNVYTVFK